MNDKKNMMHQTRKTYRERMSGDCLLRADCSGSRTKQLRELAAYLNRYLDHCVSMRWHGAVVFDIDDTLLTLQNDTSVEMPCFANIFRKFRHDLPLYLVTARREMGRVPTQRELAAHNLRGYRELRMAPNAMTSDFGRWKWQQRLEIARKHMRVLAAIGDQVWDAFPHPVPRSLQVYNVRGPRDGCLVRVTSRSEVGVLLPSLY